MIIITSDINKQTYVPALGVLSLYLLFYKKKHPKTLGYVSVPQQAKFSHFFPKKCATCFSPWLPHDLCSFFVLLKYTTV